MDNTGIFYDLLEYFTAVWFNLWPFGIFCGHLVYFPRFGMFGPRKIWQPCSHSCTIDFLRRAACSYFISELLESKKNR
jgi:hypothetical protein